MSIISQRKRVPISDLKIKLSFLLRHLENGWAYFYPDTSPGDFTSPLGLKRLINWHQRVEQKDKLIAWTAILFAGPVGWYGVFEEPVNIFAILFVIWAALGAWFLASKHEEKVQKNKEKISTLEAEIRKLKEK